MRNDVGSGRMGVLLNNGDALVKQDSLSTSWVTVHTDAIALALV